MNSKQNHKVLLRKRSKLSSLTLETFCVNARNFLRYRLKLSSLWIFILILTGCYPTIRSNQVCYKRQCIDVEVANSQESLIRGLQYRDDLKDNEGMLFIFEKNGRHSFWMRNTLIPLDVIWMNHDRHIVHIEYNLQPCIGDYCPSYTPGWDALYVLEVNAGKAAQLGLSLGDKLEFRLKSVDYLPSNS